MQARPLLLGHRGSRWLRSIPENTVRAFDLALQHGCDGFEFDVRCTRDGRPIICHDPRWQGNLIAESDRAALRHLVPLEAVLSRYGKRAFLDIEIKVTGIEEAVLRVLSQLPPECVFVISSFLPGVLMDIRERDDSIPLGIIFERRVPRWQGLPVDYLMAQKSLVTRRLIDDAHEAGKKLFAWTVNDKKAMLRLARWGVDGIISDKTKVLVAALREAHPDA
jgi:glycerophosphoryl diester phosphodiesterase